MKSRRSGFYRQRDGTDRLWLSPTDIEAMMEDALRKSSLSPTEEDPAVDLERFIQALGVRLDQYGDLEPSVLGQTEFYPDGSTRILINRDLTGAIDDDYTPPGVRGRWRATMAHEASHVLMHRVLFEVNKDQGSLFRIPANAEAKQLMRCLKKNVLFRGSSASDWREVQANLGMAALLMPQDLFRRLAARAVEEHRIPPQALSCGSSAATALISKMATHFDVSRQAAGIRLETLGILSQAVQPWLTEEQR